MLTAFIFILSFAISFIDIASNYFYGINHYLLLLMPIAMLSILAGNFFASQKKLNYYIENELRKMSDQEITKKKSELIEKELRRIISEHLPDIDKTRNNLVLEGAIEGTAPQVVQTQLRMSKAASLGDNVVLVGDAVGTVHWSTGSGMQLGAVMHPEALKRAVLDIEQGVPKEKALESYSKSALRDTKYFGPLSVKGYYPNIMSTQDRKKVYYLASTLWENGKVSSPARALELMFPNGIKSKVPVRLGLKCDEILLRVLGDL